MDSMDIKKIDSLELLDIYKKINDFLEYLDKEIVEVEKMGDNHE